MSAPITGTVTSGDGDNDRGRALIGERAAPILSPSRHRENEISVMNEIVINGLKFLFFLLSYPPHPKIYGRLSTEGSAPSAHEGRKCANLCCRSRPDLDERATKQNRKR